MLFLYIVIWSAVSFDHLFKGETGNPFLYHPYGDTCKERIHEFLIERVQTFIQK